MAGTTDALGASPELTLLIVAFLAIGGYNVIELIFWIYDFFRKHSGLYFWSITTATSGAGSYIIFLVLREFTIAPPLATGIGIALSFPFMVTGQILVLYSRLHLVAINPRILRFVLGMIIVTTVVFTIPLAILLIGDQAGDKHFTGPERIYEKLSITAACVREFIVCGIYIFEAFRHLRPVVLAKGCEGRRVMVHLIMVNIAVIILDTSLLVMEYLNRREIKLSYSAITHTVKLKMEFGILNKLIKLVQSPMALYHPDSGHGFNLQPCPESPHDRFREKPGQDLGSSSRTPSGESCEFTRKPDDSACRAPFRAVSWDHIIHGSVDPDAILPASSSDERLSSAA